MGERSVGRGWRHEKKECCIHVGKLMICLTRAMTSAVNPWQSDKRKTCVQAREKNKKKLPASEEDMQQLRHPWGRVKQILVQVGFRF